MRNVTEFQNFAAWFNLHIDLVRFVNHNPSLEEAHKESVYKMLLSVIEMQTKFVTLGVASEKTDFSQKELPGLYQLITPTELEKKIYHGTEPIAQRCLDAFQAVAANSSHVFPADIQQRLDVLKPQKKASRSLEPSFA